MSKMIQLDQFLGRPLRTLLKVRPTVLKNVFKSLVNRVLKPLGMAASAVDVGIYPKILCLELLFQEPEH